LHPLALTPEPEQQRSFVWLRPLLPGDLGWVISRHGAVYASEYGLDRSFEVRVAEIVVEVMRNFDREREAAWIAEYQGRPVGSVFVVDAGDDTAKLRMLIVEREARGQGVGRILTAAAIGFAREAGYKRMVLWTMGMLSAARTIYTKAGFRLVDSVPGVSFGCHIIDETWELDLR
jgi:GNAT superfamily N-acetyltransferase